MAEEVVKRKRGRPRKTESSEQIKTEKAESGASEQIDSGIENNENLELKTEAKKITPKKQMLQDYYAEVKEMAFTEFDIKPTLNNNSRCSMCGKEKSHTDFFRSYSLLNIDTLLSTGERHLHICKRCAKKIFEYYLNNDKDTKLALNHWCQTLDIYFSDLIYQRAIDLREGRKGTGMTKKFDFITDYMTALGTAKMINMTYWDSPYLQNKIESEIATEENVPLDLSPQNNYPEEFDEWEKEDLENYDYILQVYKYDPFKDESLEDRRKLYYTLAGFSDENISEDTGKATACIDMCRGIQRLEKLNRMRIYEEESDDPDVKKIKMMSELQEKERKSIQSYQKEWGFNQKYALNKSAGAGTLTGILKQMDENQFEDALVNRYDIATCEGMRQAAEASWAAIFNQLNISESEYAKIVSDQNEKIRKLNKQLADTKELLRRANIELKKNELQELLDFQEGDSL